MEQGSPKLLTLLDERVAIRDGFNIEPALRIKVLRIPEKHYRRRCRNH